MYSPQQIAAMRGHPDRQRLLAAVLDAFDSLPNRTPTGTEVMDRIRNGVLEVLFDDSAPPAGGLAPGENPVILGAAGVLGNPAAPAEQIQGLMLSVVHEGVHHLDVATGRARPGAAATVEQRFLTELHAHAAEFEVAAANGLTHLLHQDVRGARHLEDIAAGVLTAEGALAAALYPYPATEAAVIRQVAGLLPAVPRAPVP
jgi:hypothetical protein